MWRESPTFRRQCARLAAERGLTVNVRAEGVRIAPAARARTEISRRNGLLSYAEIVLLASREHVELIAHEVEHVIEQLDGAQLRDHTCGGRNGDRDPYESCRALEMGRRVALEVREGHVSRALMIRQRDAFSGPLDAATASISANGRYVAFRSSARLAVADEDDEPDLYVVDLDTNRLTLETGSPGSGARGGFLEPAISGDGRVLIFRTLMADPAARGGASWRFVIRDRVTAAEHILTLDPPNAAARREYGTAVVSADGTAIAVESTLLDGSGRGLTQIELVRLPSMSIEPISVTCSGGRGHGTTPTVNADGRYVAFMSHDDLTCGATEWRRKVNGDRNRKPDIYVRDNAARTKTRVSRTPDEGDANGASSWPSISADGRFVAFTSAASNLVKGDENRQSDVFVHDTLERTTQILSQRPDGKSGNGASRHAVVSGDGRTVVFQSLASDLMCVKQCAGWARDINLVWDIFMFHLESRRLFRASADQDEEWMEPSSRPMTDASGRVLIFSSRHPIDGEDMANDDDLFIQVR